jgi:hypothetical protein
MHPPTLRFADLNPLGRAIILAVAVLTLGVAAVAFLTSYGALFAYVRDTGLYSPQLTRLYPLLLDAAFIVAELGAIFFGIIRGPKGWPVFTMLLTGFLSIWFNVAHAGHGWDRRLIASLPPILMMLAFQIDVSVVRAVMAALGKPLESPASGETLLGPGAQNASLARFQVGQLGQQWGSGGEVPAMAGKTGAAELETDGGVTKRIAVERYLARLGDSLTLLTNREIAADLAQDGVEVTAQYVGEVRSRFMSPAGQNGAGRKKAKT